MSAPAYQRLRTPDSGGAVAPGLTGGGERGENLFGCRCKYLNGISVDTLNVDKASRRRI